MQVRVRTMLFLLLMSTRQSAKSLFTFTFTPVVSNDVYKHCKRNKGVTWNRFLDVQ
jgi:hypothetical protein